MIKRLKVIIHTENIYLTNKDDNIHKSEAMKSNGRTKEHEHL